MALDTNRFVGCLIDMRVGEAAYQGYVDRVNVQDQTITLRKAMKNGVLCKPDTVVVSAFDIRDMKVLKLRADPPEASPAKATQPHNGSPSKMRKSADPLGYGVLSAVYDDAAFLPQNESAFSATSQPSKKGSKPNNSFLVAPLNYNELEEDFDFSENNAKFKKEPVVSCTPKPTKNFKHTENVIKDENRVYQAKSPKSKSLAPVDTSSSSTEAMTAPLAVQFSALDSDDFSYVTDSDLRVPTITFKQRLQFLSDAARKQFGAKFVAEILARSCVELCMQIVGGSARIPGRSVRIVLLCGAQCPAQCEIALRLVRHFTNRDVELSLYVPTDFSMVHGGVKPDDFLASLAGKSTKILRSVRDLDATDCDIIVSLLAPIYVVDFRHFAEYADVVRWANTNRAKVFGVEPVSASVELAVSAEVARKRASPFVANGGEEQPILDVKWALFGVAPLGGFSAATSVFLCDLGLPKQLYDSAGMRGFVFPFASKFVIPLHRVRSTSTS